MIQEYFSNETFYAVPVISVKLNSVNVRAFPKICTLIRCACR